MMWSRLYASNAQIDLMKTGNIELAHKFFWQTWNNDNYCPNNHQLRFWVRSISNISPGATITVNEVQQAKPRDGSSVDSGRGFDLSYSYFAIPSWVSRSDASSSP